MTRRMESRVTMPTIVARLVCAAHDWHLVDVGSQHALYPAQEKVLRRGPEIFSRWNPWRLDGVVGPTLRAGRSLYMDFQHGRRAVFADHEMTGAPLHDSAAILRA